ncbi:OmpA family protein [Mariniflexile aquimaris]|uniref:OmpA family protein n=1 Tax=Mariniflexile aquimaris TaxID=881009 RepID=A0ABW3BVH8_9FLAO
MILKKEMLLAILVANVFVMHSQTTEITKKDSTIVSSWIVGVGYNIVDDSSDDGLKSYFDVKSTWHAVPYPSRISIGKYFKNGLGLEVIASYNKYKIGKIVDGLPPLTEEKNYYSVDSRLSYDLNKIIGETGWFDPYTGVGIGFTDANSISRGTINGILGFRTWFSDRFGLDVNTSGKWRMNKNATNHLQHAIGVVYRFNAEKDLTEEGKEKLKLIEAEKKELVRINDSIAAANKVLEEKRLLAEKLAKQKELERLEQLKNQEKNEIQNKLDALEPIYFAFNSSNLSTPSKNMLSKLVLILNEYPKLSIAVNSHTDSRGPAVYNQKLSESRLQSTLDYLYKNGIDPTRIVGKAFGEEQLVNECDDHTKCSESKHKQNRRSEIKVIQL